MKAYVNEIFDISRDNKTDWNNGADMFLANIRNAGHTDLPHYAGANLDYAALKPHLKALQDSKQDFIDAVMANYQEVVHLRNQGEFEKVVALFEGV